MTLEKQLKTMMDDFWFPSRTALSYNHSGKNYPPYNLIRVSETETVLEIAVAGFKETELNVSVDAGILKISGKKTNDDVANYLYKGIGTRSFEKSFTLSKDAKVTEAEYADGILAVHVQYEIAEEKKPKSIPISQGERMYLTERDDIV